jgi:hypothetical protein
LTPARLGIYGRDNRRGEMISGTILGLALFLCLIAYKRLRPYRKFGGVAPDHCPNLAYPDGELARMHGAPAKAFQLACEPRLSRGSLRAANRWVEFRSADPGCTWGAPSLSELVGRAPGKSGLLDASSGLGRS